MLFARVALKMTRADAVLVCTAVALLGAGYMEGIRRELRRRGRPMLWRNVREFLQEPMINRIEALAWKEFGVCGKCLVEKTAGYTAGCDATREVE